MAAQRLPGKPLLKINNLPIISHVVDRAKDSGVGEVVVCAEDKEIVSVVEKNGGKAILTGSHHKNGTERIYEGIQKLKKKGIDFVLSLQGDEPTVQPKDIVRLNNLMIENNAEIGTLAAEIKNESMMKNRNVVKVITKEKLNNYNFAKASNFLRIYESKENLNIYHHIGIYCYKFSILEKFVALDQTENENKNSLEQFRALDNNININVALASTSPIGIDTNEDYLELKKIMEYKP